MVSCFEFEGDQLDLLCLINLLCNKKGKEKEKKRKKCLLFVPLFVLLWLTSITACVSRKRWVSAGLSGGWRVGECASMDTIMCVVSVNGT